MKASPLSKSRTLADRGPRPVDDLHDIDHARAVRGVMASGSKVGIEQVKPRQT